jgi:hypothetical protein
MFAALIPWGDGGMGDWGNGMAPFGQINAYGGNHSLPQF